MSKFLIRPHHLLCMRYFQGCGYSDEFTENMRYVISNLKNGSEVLLTRGCDDICRKCPNNRKNTCCDGEKVKSYDSAVISLCNLDFDKVYEYGCLYSLVENNIIKKRYAPLCMRRLPMVSYMRHSTGVTKPSIEH